MPLEPSRNGDTPRPFSRLSLREMEALAFVLNCYCRGYADVAVKARIDQLADPAPKWVRFWPGEAGDHFFLTACTETDEGAVKLYPGRTGATANLSFFLPMKALEIPRPARGRKVHLACTFETNSPYGKALRISTRPVQNEKAGTRTRQ